MSWHTNHYEMLHQPIAVFVSRGTVVLDPATTILRSFS
jgi:hypothetical protein